MFSDLAPISAAAEGKYGLPARLVFPFGFLLLLLSTLTCASALATEAYMEELQGEAARKKLHADPYWHILLHYKPRLLRGVESLVDDPDFFLAPDGKHNPESELNATIEAFFEPADDRRKHPVCRFVARFSWLVEKLSIDILKLPVSECVAFENLLKQMHPESVSLVFPTSFMNSPASMFGHTLLTFDSTPESKLLSHALNYSAVTDETFGPLFAVKGIFGLYEGYFSILPYYAKIQEYSESDHRDMWEYALNFDKREIRRMLMHAYEMDHIHSDYFFFDENCSYVLLFILEAGRPSLDLTHRMPKWAIPLDTVKAVKEAGLVSGVVYRPSKTTRIRRLMHANSTENASLAKSIIEKKVAPEAIVSSNQTVDEKIGVCELAVEYLQYLYSKKKMEKQDYLGLYLNLLEIRSTFGRSGESDDIASGIPVPPRPDEGHDSSRLRIGAGAREGDLFQEISYRPANHDILDDSDGYIQGGQIVFADTVFRYYPAKERLQLQSFDAIDILSLSPVDSLFTPKSWKVRTGLRREPFEDDDDEHLIFELNFGGGYAIEKPFPGTWYFFLESDSNLGGILEDNHAVGFGVSVGWLREFRSVWRLHLFARDIYYPLGDRRNLFEVGFAQDFTVGKNFGVRFEIESRSTRHIDVAEGKVSWNWYF